MKTVNRGWALLATVAIYLVTIVFPLSNVALNAQTAEQTITFDNQQSLEALSYQGKSGSRVETVRAARYTFAGSGPTDIYKEHDMSFQEGIIPPDPASNPLLVGHYHLVYEDPSINANLLTRVADPAFNPALQPRYLADMLPGQVIQMTYDPNNNGIPDPFTLKRIRVLAGRLNIGIKSNRFGIAIYNNLTAGFEWTLLDGDNITRATLEQPYDQPTAFAVDNIVFEAFPPTGVGALYASSNSDRRPADERNALGNQRTVHPGLQCAKFSEAIPPFADPQLVHFANADFSPLPKIDIMPGTPNVINPLSAGELEVAVITTPGFDATSLDRETVAFGPNRAKAVGGEIRDVDGDGNPDLVLRFNTLDVGIKCSDTILSLTGQTIRGETIAGLDFITTVGCNETPAPSGATQ